MGYKVRYNRYEVDNAIRKLAFALNVQIGDAEKNVIVLTLLEGGSYLSSKIMGLLPISYLNRVINKSMKVSSYHGQEQHDIRFDYEPDVNFKDKTVFVIDDFCDSGNTINAVDKYLKDKGAKSVSFFTLLARKGYKLDPGVKLRYGILDDTKNFYIGCGLDDQDTSRFFDEIGYYD